MSSSRRLLLLVGAVVSMAAAFLILHTGALPGQSSSAPPIAPQLHAIAPDFSATTASGDVIHLTDLRGTPVILNFWATWCGPCALEMPILQSIFEDYHETGLRILAVNMGESAAEIETWRDTYRLRYDLLVDEAQSIAALYQLRGQPSTYVISPEGRITDIFFGPVSESTLIAALD